MPATVEIRRLTSTTPTSTNVTSANTRLNAEDAASTGTTNPIQIPTSGTKYSFWATFQLHCTVAPSVSISELKWFTDGTGSFGTGIGLNAARATSYVQATGTAGDTGTELTTGNHAGITGSPVNAFTYTSASPLALTGSTSTTGAFGDRVVLQLTVGTTAAPGITPTETLTFRYDEI
jgi:hypothetical protein